MISPSKVVGKSIGVILKVGLWSLESVLASILELILDWSLKITYEIYLLRRCTCMAVHAIMIFTTDLTNYRLRVHG